MEWVTVETFWSVEEAQMALGFLQAEGILCRLDNLAVSSFFPHLANAAGGVKLQVAGDEVERAVTLLTEAHTHCYVDDSSELDSDVESGGGQSKFDADDDDALEHDEDHPGLLERLRKFKLFSFLMVLTGG